MKGSRIMKYYFDKKFPMSVILYICKLFLTAKSNISYYFRITER